MSKTLTAGMSSHLQGEVLSLATCWKLTREDGTVMGFTDHDVDLTYNGVTYQADTGFTPTDIDSSAALNVDNLEVAGLLTSTSIQDADIEAGLYDNAQVEIFLLRWDEAPTFASGAVILRRGYIGEIRLREGQFVAEVRGLTEALQQTVGDLYGPACRADLGDARCQVSLAAFTKSGTVSAVTDRRDFTSSLTSDPDGWFDYGLLTWTSGANSGYSMEVKRYTQSGGRFELQLKMPYDVQPGDGFNVYAGCDKTLTTCRDRFANVINFRGEPHLPGMDELMRFGGQ